jgi:exopolysaccharide biosynthesis polyprenyl glycosylphosphotransferase
MSGGHPDLSYPLVASGTTNGPYGQGYAAAGRAPSAQAPGSPASPTSAPIDDADEEDMGYSTTTRMARLSRNPEYREVERLLANRRRARARLSEMMLLVDAALSVLLILLIEHFSDTLANIVPQIRYLKTSDALIFAAIVAVVWPVVFSLLGLYRSSWVNNIFAPMRAFIAVGLAGLAVSGILYFLVLDRMRIFWLTFVIVDAVLLALARVVLRPLARLGAPRRRILIIGTGRLAIDAARAVSARSAIGLEIIGVVGPRREFHPEPDMSSHWQEALYHRWVSWRLGELRDAPRVIREKQVDLVLIALSPRERYEASWLISSLANLPVQLYVLPDVVTETAKIAVDEIDGIPVIGLTESAISGWNARAKRLMDLAICIPFLIVTAPLMLLIALIVRLDSRGPALFKQERIGQHNRRFVMLKFRTMRVDTEQRMKEAAERTATKDLVHKRRDNPNITRFGAFLRRTSLDELPQLLNILKGDMSVVGPRPELPWIVERYRAWQYRRLLVPQGLTGWWQVNGRSNRVLHLHTQDDIFYVRNYSLWLDIKILLMTIKIVLTGRGAF